MPEQKSTVIVAPHPDDETLAAGGLIATQRLRHIPVMLLPVTDGEAAYPDLPDLGRSRRVKQPRAAEALGIARDAVIATAVGEMLERKVAGYEPQAAALGGYFLMSLPAAVPDTAVRSDWRVGVSDRDETPFAVSDPFKDSE